MSWTKGQFVTAAFEEIGISSYNYDLQPEMLELALKRLDAMIGTWNARGIRLAYPIQANPDNADLSETTNVPDSANEAIYLNLAIRIAPVFGKVVSQDLKQAAFQAYSAMQTKTPVIPEMQFNQTIPAGAGNKWRRNYSPMLRKPENRIASSSGDFVDYN